MLRCLTGIITLVFVVSAQDTPGFQFLGYGYDILYANPKSTQGDGDPGFRTNIFTFTRNEHLMTPDGKWTVPDKTTSQDFGQTCSATQSSQILVSSYDYQHVVDNGVSLDGGFFGIEFSLSVDFKNIDRETRNKTSIFAHVDAKCAAYDLTLHTYDHPPLDPNFVAGVKYLPSNYSEEEYMEFLHNFGTHVVVQMQVGGRWGWQMEFDRLSYINLLDNTVNVELGIKYAGEVQAGFGFNHTDHMKDYMSVVNAISSNSTFNVGGKFTTNMTEWMESVKADPMPTHLSLTSLDRLITPLYISDINADVLEAKAKAMKQALVSYCPYVQKNYNASVTCKPAAPLPPPTPDPVASNAVRRICVLNDGGYAMNWELHDETARYPVIAQTGTYPLGQTNCLDGLQIGADHGDKLNCRVNRIAGKSEDCQGGNITFDPRAKQQANFKCDGTTFTGSCYFVGFSAYGAKANGVRTVDIVV